MTAKWTSNLTSCDISVSDGRKAGKVQGHLLLLIACLPILGMLVIAPILPDLQRHFENVRGAAYLAPLTLTAPAIMVVIVSPFATGLVATFGRRRTLLGAMMLYTVAATAPLYLASLWAIIASRLLVGAAEALLMTVSTMLLGDYYEARQRETYLSMQVAYTSVSAVLFLLIGGALGQMSWRTPFVAYLSALVLLPFALGWIWEPVSPVPRADAKDEPRVPWRLLWPIYILTFVAGGCMNLVSVELAYLVEAVGTASNLVKGVVAAANSSGIAIGALLMGWRGDAGARWQAQIALLLAAAGFGVIALAQSVVVVALGAAVIGAASGFYLGWLLAAANRPLTFANRGRAIGIWMSCYFAATVIAPLAAVAAAHLAGKLQYAMLPFGGALLVAAFLFRAKGTMPVVALSREPGADS